METKRKKMHFEEIYAKEADGLFRFCHIRISDRDQALDIVQESFMELWKAMVNAVIIKHERAFLFTVARNRIIDWYRKSKSLSLDKMIEDSEDEGSTPFLPKDEKAHGHIVASAEARHAIEAIDRLRPEYREAVYLRLVEDLPPREIAEILGISTNAASVRIFRGVQLLQEALGIKEKDE